ncbi:FIMAH domain-containing protein [Aquipuribacter sp. MA13-6]|uniref:FIMAH domain-containing protein n=1 Tax=unclassified Aquipuribacter TaxID=2635084 RepID=UPI003EEAD458
MAGLCALALAVAGLTAAAAPEAATVQAPPEIGQADRFEHFLTREGNRVMDGEEEFRFLSVATPTLGLVEDNYPFEDSDDFEWRWPDTFEIDDHLETIQRMGGQATRIYDISVLHPDDDPDLPRHVTGVPRHPDGSLNPDAFSEEGFRVLDQVLASAAEHDVRIFIPITNQYQWHGGLAALSANRGIDPGPSQVNFYNSEVLREDYKAIVDYITDRTNTITGVKYKDDPTIAAWVFGNEIANATNPWLTEMAAHVKDRAPNHLTMQHDYNQARLDYILAEPNIDIVATSVYDNYTGNSPAGVRQRAQRITPVKPYIAFEFGFAETEDIEEITDILIEEGAVGGQLWGLRPHNRDGGFYWHGDEFGGSYRVRSYHFPGFDTGERYDERTVMSLMQAKAYEIRGLPVPPTEAPGRPTVLPVEHVSELYWQGSAGAESYVLERATSPDGPWTVLVDGVTDDVAHTPIWNDTTAELHETYWYRVTAQNEGGRSEPSQPWGPITVDSLALTDDLVDFAQASEVTDGLVIDDGNNRPLIERLSRAVRAPGAPPQEPIVLDFEDGSTAGWNLPSWMAQNDLTSSLRVVDAAALGGTDSLAIPVSFAAGGGGQAGPEHRFTDAPVDILGRDTVTMRVHAPVAGLRANLVFNGPWNPGAERTLAVGWNDLTFDIGEGSTDFASIPDASSTWLVRIASAGLAEPFRGDVLVDDVEWTSSTYVEPEPGEQAPREHITYSVEGNPQQLSLYTFFEAEVEHFEVSTSTDGVTFEPVEVQSTQFGTDDETYGYWLRVLYEDEDMAADVRHVRVGFPTITPERTGQLDRVELEYVPVSMTSLDELVDYYAGTGELDGTLAAQLDRLLGAAQSQLDAGRTRQAQQQLDRFETLVTGPAQVTRGRVTAEARDLLVADLTTVGEDLTTG